MVRINPMREFFVSRLPSIGKTYVEDWFHIQPITHGFLLRPKRGNLLFHHDKEKVSTQTMVITKYTLIDTKNKELIQFEHRQPYDNSETTLEIIHWKHDGLLIENLGAGVSNE